MSSQSIHDLPSDLLSEVLYFLQISDIAKAGRATQIFREVANSNLLWMKICKTEIDGVESERHEGEDWKQAFLRLYRKFEVVTQGTGKNFLELGKGSRAVTSGSQTNEWVVARVQRPSMTGGRNYCEFRVKDYVKPGDDGNFWKLSIGIISSVFSCDVGRWVGSNGAIWSTASGPSAGYISNMGYKTGPSCEGPGAPYGSKYGVDDRIGVLADWTKKEGMVSLYFYKNDVCEGKAFELPAINNVSRQPYIYYFALSISRPNISIEVLPASAPVILPSEADENKQPPPND